MPAGGSHLKGGRWRVCKKVKKMRGGEEKEPRREEIRIFLPSLLLTFLSASFVFTIYLKKMQKYRSYKNDEKP
jgi:hypothetical protein